MSKCFYYIDSFAEYCYPYEEARRVKDWGCLSAYAGKRFSKETADRLIQELVTRYPYIEGSMYLRLNIMKCEISEGKRLSYYKSFDFRNNEYHKEQRRSKAIKYAR